MRRQRLGLRELPDQAVHASREVRRAWIRRVVLTLVAGVFLAISGAFGSQTAPFPVRVGFWVLGIGIGTAIGGSIAGACDRLGWPKGLWGTVVFVALATALPTTVLIWVLDSLVFYHGHFDARMLTAFLSPVLTVTIFMTGLNAFVGRQPVMTHMAAEATVAAKAAPGPRATARLFDRLPHKLRGAELWAVEAEDHYLRLHTSKGSDLILLRLADAMAELDGIEGAQTHRSWWVARSAVQGGRRTDGRATLLLKGGLEAPVSRTYVRALRAANWF